MVHFDIEKKSKKSRARLGVLKTSHGEIETPSLVPVATQAVVKTLSSDEAERTGSQVLIANTFHLHLKPGEEIVKRLGGLHDFMNWRRPLMTDSGGFQVFSLGFGRDLQVGKMLKYFPESDSLQMIEKSTQPKSVRIEEDGVSFRSPLDGSKLFVGPKESIRIQEALGADIIFAFDECTPPTSTHDYAEDALLRTHRWADICLDTKKSKQALFGIVQGSHFKDLREVAAKHINALPFDGFGIGGDLGRNKKTMIDILRWTIPYLDEQKPRHLLGVGHPEDIEPIIKEGVDTFDCIMPTQYARRGIAFTPHGKLDMRKRRFLKERKRLDASCSCFVCNDYSRAYITHLLRAEEMTGMKLLTLHNLTYFNAFVAMIREKIKRGVL